MRLALVPAALAAALSLAACTGPASEDPPADVTPSSSPSSTAREWSTVAPTYPPSEPAEMASVRDVLPGEDVLPMGVGPDGAVLVTSYRAGDDGSVRTAVVLEEADGSARVLAKTSPDLIARGRVSATHVFWYTEPRAGSDDPEDYEMHFYDRATGRTTTYLSTHSQDLGYEWQMWPNLIVTMVGDTAVWVDYGDYELVSLSADGEIGTRADTGQGLQALGVDECARAEGLQRVWVSYSYFDYPGGGRVGAEYWAAGYVSLDVGGGEILPADVPDAVSLAYGEVRSAFGARCGPDTLGLGWRLDREESLLLDHHGPIGDPPEVLTAWPHGRLVFLATLTPTHLINYLPMTDVSDRVGIYDRPDGSISHLDVAPSCSAFMDAQGGWILWGDPDVGGFGVTCHFLVGRVAD